MDQILGQQHACDILRSAMAADKLHHAYIFHGPVGVGKFTVAKAFARILLCSQLEADLVGQPQACGGCESCRLLGLDTPTHPDLHLIHKELAKFSADPSIRNRKLLTIPVEVLKQWLIDPVYKAAQLKHHKVFIVDEAELLNAAGQNALLKTLEEPPAGTFIILVTSSEDRLLPTIRSRCQRVGFLPLSNELIEKWIELHHSDLPEKDRLWLIGFSQGSIGRLELALDYDLIQWAQALVPRMKDVCAGRYVSDLGATMLQGVDDFAKAWVDRHQNASKEAANKQAAGLLWGMLGLFFSKRIKQLATTFDPQDVLANDDAMAPWLKAIDAITAAEQELATNVNTGLVMDHFVSKIYRSFVNLPQAISR